MKAALVVWLSLVVSSSGFAQHAHGTQKGPSGAPMEDVAGIHLEMVASGQTLTFNVLDADVKPLSNNGITATVLLVSGSDRETITLVPHGEKALKGEAKKEIQAGSTINVTLKTAAGKSGQAKFNK